MNDYEYTSFSVELEDDGPLDRDDLAPEYDPKKIDAAYSLLCWNMRPIDGWFGGHYWRLTDQQYDIVSSGLIEARSLQAVIRHAIDLLNACDTAIPSARRAALARVREALEGEG